MPMWRPRLRPASIRSSAISRLGPISTAFQGRPQVLLACSFFQSVKPSWCFEVSATYFAPERSKTSAQWSGS